MLDDKAAINRVDSQNMLGSIEKIGEQIKEVWALGEGLQVPASYRKIKNIVVMGMGGSALGAHCLKAAFFDTLPVPFEIVNNYHVPGYVGPDTLVIASSYSGTTEEAVAGFKEAARRKAKLLVISSGGELGKLAKAARVPALIFTTQNNPCGSPRMGLGYSIFGQLILLSKVGLCTLTPALVKNTLKLVEMYQAQFGVLNQTTQNPAKQLALALEYRSIWLSGAEHLAGSVHAMANQLNENAKRFGGYFLVPELNHHLMEGLAHPASNKKTIAFLLIESGLYDQKIQKRFAVTKEVLAKNEIVFAAYACQEKTKWGQVVECLLLGGYLSFYSAMIQGTDPTAIPLVDYFKEKLKKPERL